MRVINIIANAAIQAACYISEMTTVSVLLTQHAPFPDPDNSGNLVQNRSELHNLPADRVQRPILHKQ